MEEDLLLELLKIDSESGNEKELGEFIVKRLEKNFKVEIQKIKENFNIFAYTGKPKTIFSTHLDTVPGKLEIKNDGQFIYGRGACDSKSQITAMILASEKALEKGMKDFGLLFTVQEETDFAGAKKAVELVPDSVELVVYGEPSNLEILSGQKGLMTFKIICKGKAAHGSTPEKGINAIEILMKNLQKLKQLDFEKNNSLGENSLNIGIIKGGTAVNVVPDYAEATIEIRNTIDPKKILEKIKQELEDIEIDFVNFYEPVFNAGAENLAGKLGLKTKIISYFTEMYFFKDKANTLVIGAGNDECAHTNNERVSIEELKKLVNIYLKIIKNQNASTNS